MPTSISWGRASALCIARCKSFFASKGWCISISACHIRHISRFEWNSAQEVYKQCCRALVSCLENRHFTWEHKWNYSNACSMKHNNILQVKNAVANSVSYTCMSRNTPFAVLITDMITFCHFSSCWPPNLELCRSVADVIGPCSRPP